MSSAPVSSALIHAGVAIDALFRMIHDDKLKLADLFTRIDTDRSGTLEPNELAACLKMLGVQVDDSIVSAIMDSLDDNGDGVIVIAEFFEAMERLKEQLRAARHEKQRAERAALERSARLQRIADARGTATGAFFTVLRSRAGIQPGVSAPKEWDRVDCDGERGVLPAGDKPWEKPPERTKSDGPLHGKSWKALKRIERKTGVGWWAGECSETEGWVPPLRALVTQVCTPTVPTVDIHFDEAALKEFFTVLRIESQGIDRLDQGFAGFSRLEEAYFAGNCIRTIENLPGSLKQFDFGTNKISVLPALGRVSSQLRYIGLAYNDISDSTMALEQEFSE